MMYPGGSVGAAVGLASGHPMPSGGGSGSTGKRRTVQTTVLVMFAAPFDARTILTVRKSMARVGKLARCNRHGSETRSGLKSSRIHRRIMFIPRNRQAPVKHVHLLMV